jgi:A/G-specific adenine glycosylase
VVDVDERGHPTIRRGALASATVEPPGLFGAEPLTRSDQMTDGEEGASDQDATGGHRATGATDPTDERADTPATAVTAATGEAVLETDLERLRAALPASARERLDGERLDGEGPDAATLAAIRTALVEWYETDHRAFPWRETTDPYEILVSEVMSQQTQLSRVVDAWAAFLDEWPTVEALAGADRGAVVGFWSDHSLGYNNRAKYLHEAAGQVVDEYDGSFPESPDELQELMGVGPYTANAVASFAFDNGDAVVDTNVKRVLYRALDVPDDDDAFERVASALMPPGESRVWNNAMMELGGVACQKKPRCDEAGCPWREWCHAYQTGDFTAPDVPTQPSFEGSRRQFRGRIVRLLGEHDEMDIDTLGHRIRVDYTPEGEHGREWLRGLLSDLSDDGLVHVEDGDGQITARLQ